MASSSSRESKEVSGAQVMNDPLSVAASRVVAEVEKAQALFGENQSLGKDLGGHVKTSPVPDRQLDHTEAEIRTGNKTGTVIVIEGASCMTKNACFSVYRCGFSQGLNHGHPYPAAVSTSSHLTGGRLFSG
ncbi:hypothetical protein FOXYSP1_06066 [Fusarium oxysporum f. sp. phaseoli]